MVNYHNSENVFCVLRVKVSGKRDVVTVVGTLHAYHLWNVYKLGEGRVMQ